MGSYEEACYPTSQAFNCVCVWGGAIVALLESRVLLSSSLPADIDQLVQDSGQPEAWYAALDVMLPALEQAVAGEDAAIESYNTLVECIAYQYGIDLADLSNLRQTSLENTNTTFWNTVGDAEENLACAYTAALFDYYSTTGPASQTYESTVQALQQDFDNAIWDELYNGGDGAGLWETMLTGEISAWNTFIGVRQGALATLQGALDGAVTTWTQAVDPAYVTRESTFASIYSSTNASHQQLNDDLITDLAAADQQLADDLSFVEGNWVAAISDARQAWLAAAYNPSGYGGFTWTGPQDPNSTVVANAFVGFWDGILGAGPGAFDTWESAEWEAWRVISSQALANKPVADTLFDHSLMDNPPDLAFPAGHFVTTAIHNSPELAAKVGEILQRHTASGPGTYTSDIGIVFNTGDLMAGIHSAKIEYTLVLNADNTYTLNMTLKDKYDFAFTWDYYKYSFWGVGLTVANNIAWADQHLGMIETYDWTATLPQQTGAW